MRIYLDLATAPLPEALDYIDVESIAAPSNYKDELKIAAYKREKAIERLEAAALDLDLARITGVGVWVVGAEAPHTMVARDVGDEGPMLNELIAIFGQENYLELISYNGLAFDWPMLMRRARYLGLKKFPRISTDRYRSPNRDLMAELSDRDPSRRRPLTFYARRLGLDIVKPLSGAEEARVVETGRWDDLRLSLVHDLTVMRAIMSRLLD